MNILGHPVNSFPLYIMGALVVVLLNMLDVISCGHLSSIHCTRHETSLTPLDKTSVLTCVGSADR